MNRFETYQNVLLFCIAILISNTLCYGQNDYRAVVNPPTIPSDEITVAAPEAATLNKYVDMPVNHAFGTMDISIPLFQWQCGSIGCVKILITG